MRRTSERWTAFAGTLCGRRGGRTRTGDGCGGIGRSSESESRQWVVRGEEEGEKEKGVVVGAAVAAAVVAVAAAVTATAVVVMAGGCTWVK